MSFNEVKSRIEAALESTSHLGLEEQSPAFERELSDAELERVVGGLVMLLPAVQKARDGGDRPVETLSLNF